MDFQGHINIKLKELVFDYIVQEKLELKGSLEIIWSSLIL